MKPVDSGGNIPAVAATMRRSVATLERIQEPYCNARVEDEARKKHSYPIQSLLVRARRASLIPATRQWARVISLFLLAFLMAKCLSITIRTNESTLTVNSSRSWVGNERFSRERRVPYMVQLQPPQDSSSSLRKISIVKPPPLPDNDWLPEEYKNQECVPMHKWQLPQYSPSSCNMMHETNLQSVEFINSGGSRIAFRIQNQELVLKVPKLNNDNFDASFRYSGWMDTIAMERLSASPFVLSIHGNCGVSQIIELGESSLHDLIKLARLHGDRLTPKDKLKIGLQLASGIADVHSIDGNVPSMSHNDLDPGQIILVDGVYKVSDFHLASIKYHDAKGTGKVCQEPPKDLVGWMAKMRAPEEMNFNPLVTSTYIQRETTDVWALGNMLYNVLLNKWVFEKMSTNQAKQRIMNGKHSLIPTKVRNSTDQYERAMLKAIEMAWTFDPKDRPKAREIAKYLESHLEGPKVGDFWRVSIPPLPKNYRYTESDFAANLQLM